MFYYIGNEMPGKDEKYLLRLKKQKSISIMVTDTFEWLILKGGGCFYQKDGAVFFYNGSADIQDDYDRLLKKMSEGRHLFDKQKIKAGVYSVFSKDIEAALYDINGVYLLETEVMQDELSFHYGMTEVCCFGAAVRAAAVSCGDPLLSYTTRAECPAEGSPVLRDSMGAVHQHLINLLRLNKEGVLKEYDTEFLHDLRVSVRRIRSALSMIKGVFTKGIEDDFRIRFKKLGELTGKARDMDVYLAEIEGYSSVLPENMQGSLLEIREYFEKIRAAEYRKLNRFLRSAEYDMMIDEWDRVTGTYSETGRKGFAGTKKASADVLEKAYEKVDRLTAALGQNTSDTEIHAIRIAFKKLRYCIEFFCLYLGAEKTADVLSELRNLQDCLGRFNDYSVQCVHMTEMLGRTKSAETSAACGYLLSYLAQAKEKERENAVGLVAEFRNRSKKVKKALGI